MFNFKKKGLKTALATCGVTALSALTAFASPSSDINAKMDSIGTDAILVAAKFIFWGCVVAFFSCLAYLTFSHDESGTKKAKIGMFIIVIVGILSGLARPIITFFTN